jgi:hypothetical protein
MKRASRKAISYLEIGKSFYGMAMPVESHRCEYAHNEGDNSEKYSLPPRLCFAEVIAANRVLLEIGVGGDVVVGQIEALHFV